MFAQLSAAAQAQPALAAALTMGTRYFAGDLFTQTVVERRERIDRGRLLTFGSFGFLMGGGPVRGARARRPRLWGSSLTTRGRRPAQVYYFFGRFFDRVIAPRCGGSKPAQVAAFIVCDMGVFMPFIYMPIFYTTRECVQSPLSPLEQPAEIARAAMRKLRANVLSDLYYAAAVMIPRALGDEAEAPSLLRYYAAAIMIPQDIAVHGFLPPHLKVPFVATSGFAWVLCLSFRRGDNAKVESDS
jgi:hypothetical protein